MEAGLDSLGAVELRNQLAALCPNAELPATLTFDHPTIDALAAFISGQHSEVGGHTESEIQNADQGQQALDIDAVQERIAQIVRAMVGVTVPVSQVCII